MSLNQRVLLIAPSAMTRGPAFERAGALAAALQLPLHIVAFDYVAALAVAGLFAPDEVDHAREGYLHKHRQWLGEQARHLAKWGIVVTSEVAWVKEPYVEILRYVCEMDVALIIKNAEEEPYLKRLFFTPLDWRLLRDCPAPVHLVTDSRHPQPQKILAIVDVLRSEIEDLRLNDQIVRAAVKLAGQCDAQVQLLHVFDWTAIYALDTGLGALPLATGMGELLGQAQREAFSALAERHGVAPDCRHFIEGIPLETICGFASESGTDVIVMGTVQHGGLDKLLGSTAEHLLHRAPCSVLAIKPPMRE